MKCWVSDWCATPIRLPLLGVILGVVLIQFVMRKCFAFGNLLLDKQLPDEWITSILLTTDGKLSLYFSGLVARVLLTAAIFLYVVRRGTATTSSSQFFVGILVFLLGVEFLLLPINYGVLISAQRLPRVAGFSGDEKAAEDQRNWLVWDSKDAIIYFVRDSKDQRMLVTIPRKEAGVRAVAYDDIFCVLFSANHTDSRRCPGKESHEQTDHLRLPTYAHGE